MMSYPTDATEWSVALQNFLNDWTFGPKDGEQKTKGFVESVLRHAKNGRISDKQIFWMKRIIEERIATYFGHEDIWKKGLMATLINTHKDEDIRAATGVGKLDLNEENDMAYKIPRGYTRYNIENKEIKGHKLKKCATKTYVPIDNDEPKPINPMEALADDEECN